DRCSSPAWTRTPSWRGQATGRRTCFAATTSSFADGVPSWAQIRLLAAVATPEDEAEWLSRAEGRTVRALAAVMRTPPDGDDDEARFRLRCPRRVRLLWQQVVELARRMAGSELTQGQAAEAIAAE